MIGCVRSLHDAIRHILTHVCERSCIHTSNLSEPSSLIGSPLLSECALAHVYDDQRRAKHFSVLTNPPSLSHTAETIVWECECGWVCENNTNLFGASMCFIRGDQRTRNCAWNDQTRVSFGTSIMKLILTQLCGRTKRTHNVKPFSTCTYRKIVRLCKVVGYSCTGY